MAWRFEFLGEKFDSHLLSLDDYIELEKLVGLRWGLINPLVSANCAVVLSTFLYSRRTGMAYDDVLVKAKESNADLFADSIELYTPEDLEDPPDPPPAGES